MVETKGKRTEVSSSQSEGESSPAEQEKERLMREAREKGREAVASQKATFARGLEKVAGALRRTAQNLEQEQDSSTASYFQMAADELAGLSDKVKNRDLKSMLSQSQEFSRRHPSVVFSGAMAAGFMVSRFMKSSTKKEEHTSSISTGTSSEAVTTGGPSETRAKLGVEEPRQERPYGTVESPEYAKET